MAIGDDITPAEVAAFVATQEGMSESYAYEQIFQARVTAALARLSTMPAQLVTSQAPALTADLLSVIWSRLPPP